MGVAWAREGDRETEEGGGTQGRGQSLAEQDEGLPGVLNR